MHYTPHKKYILGHKNPDTDAIVSALAYAAFLTHHGHDVEPVALGNANNETKFVLEYTGMEMPIIVDSLPDGAHIVLVDHNEEGQSIDERHKFQITSVVDHHKFAGFTTDGPLHMRIEALGSTASILYKIFKEKNYTPSPQLATIMISAILSDTLHFRSPTTTQEDKDIVEELNVIAQIADLHDYSMKMFQAKSDLGNINAKDLVELDYKVFDFGSKKAGIGVVETTNPAYALGRKDELIETMKVIKKETGLDFVLLCVVDILNEHNTCIVASYEEEAIVKEVFGAETVDGLADLGNRVSRKKQIAPQIAEIIQ